MKFSFASQRGNKPSLRGELLDRVNSAKAYAEEVQRRTTEPASIAWAITCAIAAIAWSVSSYLIAREKHRAEVELARLGVETKKQQSSH